ncbi:hypothetical protein V757_05795 [Pelistega indica]|uniref:YggT family protein n=1 Tax=Pelistega indica TaxID=1414851 RepID=V8G6W9_9BURK|nr:YggT family protein [Pelistega indica]ETD72150.1 hypothetical protein V757_05795 [Pelistega indica]
MTDALMLLLTIFTSLFCTVLIVRAWIFWRRIPPFNPYCAFIYKLSDFIVVPVRKIIPSSKNIDIPSLLIAFIVCLIEVFISYKLTILKEELSGISISLPIFIIAGLQLFINQILSVVLWLSIFYAIMSWVSPMVPFISFLRALIEPLLIPIRKIIPNALKTGPFDFSLMFLMIGILVLQTLVNSY